MEGGREGAGPDDLDARHRRQVADVAIDHAEERGDGGLVGGDAVEVPHEPISIVLLRESRASPSWPSAPLQSRISANVRRSAFRRLPRGTSKS